MKKYFLILLTFSFSIAASANETIEASAPGVPDDVKFEYFNNNRLKISWIDTSLNEESFVIMSTAHTDDLPVKTVPANTTFAYVNVVPGQISSWRICAKSASGHSCTQPIVSMAPRTNGSIRGRVFGTNFKPLANTKLHFEGLATVIHSQNFSLSEDQDRDISTRVYMTVPEHIILPKEHNADIYVDIEGCSVPIVSTYQNGMYRYLELPDNSDSAGRWMIYLSSREECDAGKISLRMTSSGQWPYETTTDQNGRFHLQDIQLAGTYSIVSADGTLTCTINETGEKTVSLVKNRKDLNLMCRKKL